jgi:hypothetical protein
VLALPIQTGNPDIALVVGGDGTFGYYGKKLQIPMLFVGVIDKDIMGSKARLAEILFEDPSTMNVQDI